MSGTVDVVVENSRAGVMDRLGVGYETLAALNPNLVYAAIRGFGDPRTGTSPYVDWPAYDVVAQAMGGVVSLTGSGDGHVVKCGPSVGDIFTGALSAVGLLAAAINARSTGQGQFVDVAMYDAVLCLCEGAAYSYSYTGRVRPATGNGHPTIAPFDIFPTSDGHCAIGTPSDRMFATLCERMGHADLADDERFDSAARRLANRPGAQRVAGSMDDVEDHFRDRSTAQRRCAGRPGQRHGGDLHRPSRLGTQHVGRGRATRWQQTRGARGSAHQDVEVADGDPLPPAAASESTQRRSSPRSPSSVDDALQVRCDRVPHHRLEQCADLIPMGHEIASSGSGGLAPALQTGEHWHILFVDAEDDIGERRSGARELLAHRIVIDEQRHVLDRVIRCDGFESDHLEPVGLDEQERVREETEDVLSRLHLEAVHRRTSAADGRPSTPCRSPHEGTYRR